MTRETIKSLRKQKKLSQAALGSLTNLSASDISRIECGYREISPAEMAAIATALGANTTEAAAASEPKKIGLGLGLSASSAAAEKPKPAEPASPPTPVAVTAPVASKPLPTGSDLSDPANFGVFPDLQLLDAGSSDDAVFRSRLSSEIARANTILHTPRVPAAVWRAWRQFEQQATARLRETPVEVVAPVKPVKIAPPVAFVDTASAEVPEKSESKSFNSLFVESARSLLPPELVERLNRAAEAARAADATIGFMKHFRNIAEKELDTVAMKLVTDEANVRAASPDRSRVRRGRRR